MKHETIASFVLETEGESVDIRVDDRTFLVAIQDGDLVIGVRDMEGDSVALVGIQPDNGEIVRVPFIAGHEIPGAPLSLNAAGQLKLYAGNEQEPTATFTIAGKEVVVRENGPQVDFVYTDEEGKDWCLAGLDIETGALCRYVTGPALQDIFPISSDTLSLKLLNDLMASDEAVNIVDDPVAIRVDEAVLQLIKDGRPEEEMVKVIRDGMLESVFGIKRDDEEEADKAAV